MKFWIFIVFFAPHIALAIANPASVYCEKVGGKLVIKNDKSGAQHGLCEKNGKTCEEWSLFRKECSFDE